MDSTKIESLREGTKDLVSKNDSLAKINQMAIELTSLASGANLHQYLACKLKSLTGAVGVAISEFDEKQRTLTIRHLETDLLLLEKFKSVTGIDLMKIVSKVDDATYDYIMSGGIGYEESLTEVTFGAIPRPVAAIMQSIANISLFIGVQYIYEGALYGTTVMGLRSGTPIPDEDFLHSFASLAAVSLRRLKAERELRESEERFRTFYQNTQIGIYRSTPDNKIMFANPALLGMLRYVSAEELVGRSITRTVPEQPESDASFAEVMRVEGRVIGRENQWERSDGTLLWVREGAYAVKGTDGRMLYIDGTVEDITSQKTAEEALERSLKEKEALFGELQHRVKNSMATICGLVSLEGNRSSDPVMRQTLQTLGDRVTSIASLYEMLYIAGTSHEVRLDEYIRKIAQTLLDGYARDAQRISFDMQAEQVPMDTRRAVPLGLIANELITNALKYAFPDQRRGVLRVALTRNERDIVLKVSDDGVGLPSDFDLQRPRGMGTRLLTMLARQLKGSITWVSGNMTLFTVTIPAKE